MEENRLDYLLIIVVCVMLTVSLEVTFFCVSFSLYDY